MSTMIENPLAIIVGGALAATLALLVFLSRRNLSSLVALGGVLMATLLLLLLERLVVTDREQVETALDGVLSAIEANDLPGVLAAIAPDAAHVRADAEALMPLIKVEVANAGSVNVTVHDLADPPTATAQFRAFLRGKHVQSGTPVGYINQQVDLTWAKHSDRWLIKDYRAYFDGEPINAVGSAAGNRPVPSR